MKFHTATLRPDSSAWQLDGLSRRILSSVFTVGALTAAVKGVAFLKELVVARQLGTGAELDAFLIAYAVWAFLIGVFAGALPDALLPVYTRARQRSQRDADTVAAQSTALYLLQIIGLTLLLSLAGAPLVRAFAATFPPEQQALTLRFFHGLAPFAILSSFSLLLNSLLHANKRFVIAAAAPAIIPAVLIATLLFGWERWGTFSLVYGTIGGAAIQLAVLLYAFGRHHFSGFRGLALFRRSPSLTLVLSTSGPYLLSGLVMGSTTLVDMTMAGWLEPGTVSVLGYGQRVCAIVLTLLATATSEAFYPYLSDMVAAEQWSELRRTVLRFSALILAASIPLIAFFWVGSSWLVSLLFERGAFTPADTARVAAVLRFLSLQIPFYLLAALGSRVVCAMLASRFMFLTTLVNFGLNLGFNLLFMRSLGAEGIALSTALVYAISAAMLYAYFLRRIRNSVATTPSIPH